MFVDSLERIKNDIHKDRQGKRKLKANIGNMDSIMTVNEICNHL